MILSEARGLETLLPELLCQARTGSAEALGNLFEACRGYLLTVARQELTARMRTKVDATDVVQEAFIEATRDFAAFHGETARQLLGWLRGILRNNLADFARYFMAGCRCLTKEVCLRDQIAAAHTDAFLAAGEPICEQLIVQEQRCALDSAIKRLPPTYREALHLHFDEERRFAEIGNSLQCSPEAARKLVGRAVERLRKEMAAYAEI